MMNYSIQPGKNDSLLVQPGFSAILRCFKWTTRMGSHWLRLQTEWVWRMWVLALTNRLRNWQLSTLALCSIMQLAGCIPCACARTSSMWYAQIKWARLESNVSLGKVNSTVYLLFVNGMTPQAYRSRVASHPCWWPWHLGSDVLLEGPWSSS